MFHILIAEDDYDICNMMKDYLERYSFEVFTALNGEEALSILDIHHIDLMITDIMMPKMNGYTLTKELRDSGYALPILMITAKETLNDKEMGFLSGTDDYMIKPIHLKEMLLRVNALLRRSNITYLKSLKIGMTTLDYETHTVTSDDEEIELSPKEFLLLFKLLSHPNKIHTKFQLMDEIWGYDSETSDTTIKVHISKLRSKFQACTDFEIITVKGLGYKAVIKNADKI